jgi:signal transduction histidine kinase
MSRYPGKEAHPASTEEELFILCVDDEENVLRSLKNTFRQEPFQVLTASSGLDGLAILQSRQDIGLILSDQRMPEMSGTTFLQKAAMIAPDIPRIILTAYMDVTAAIDAMNKGGAYRFLLKPWDEDELLQAVRSGVQSYRSTQRKIRSTEETLRGTSKEKLSSIGQLAAGVAHEINNPLSFVVSNVRIFSKYFKRLNDYVTLQRKLLEVTASAQQLRELDSQAKELDVALILEDGAELIAESLQGVERVARIVRDLKSFSRVDVPENELVDIIDCMESALTLVINELHAVATIQKAYGELPAISCHPGQINLVFMNLLINAGHAVTPPGRISLTGRYDNDFVYMEIADNGHGIPEELMERIFEPFFTTREVGKGTGLGLSISHDIVAKHGGELLVESCVGVGTTFTVKLPRNEEIP